MPEFDYDQVTACKYDMSRNEVVEILQRELTLLRSELESRDKIVADFIELCQKKAEEYQEISGPHDLDFLSYQDEVTLLKRIEDENQLVHDGLRPVAADVRRRMSDFDKLQDQRMMEQTERYSH